MGDSKTILTDCLFFTAGALARQLSSMADTCFRPTGLNPSQGFALMCIVDEPGISPSAIAERLALAPSSVTRIIETLQRFGYVTTEVRGRSVSASPTPAGQQHHARVLEAWRELHEAYSEKLGGAEGDKLCREIHGASSALSR
jgi:DNA-binding MarR family transcriptional regulator